MSDSQEQELLLSIIKRSGGIEKWRELHGKMGRVCKSRDKRGIAEFVRRSAMTDEGAVQLAMLAYLGLSLTVARLESEPLQEEANGDVRSHYFGANERGT